MRFHRRRRYRPNPDARLRDLERRAASGDLEAAAQLLLYRVRVGSLEFRQLVGASALGDQSARAALEASGRELPVRPVRISIEPYSVRRGRPPVATMASWADARAWVPALANHQVGFIDLMTDFFAYMGKEFQVRILLACAKRIQRPEDSRVTSPDYSVFQEFLSRHAGNPIPDFDNATEQAEQIVTSNYFVSRVEQLLPRGILECEPEQACNEMLLASELASNMYWAYENAEEAGYVTSLDYWEAEFLRACGSMIQLFLPPPDAGFPSTCEEFTYMSLGQFHNTISSDTEDEDYRPWNETLVPAMRDEVVPWLLA